MNKKAVRILVRFTYARNKTFFKINDRTLRQNTILLTKAIFPLTTFSVLLLCSTILLTACSDEKEAPKKKPNKPLTVEVHVAATEKVSRTVEVTGSLLPYEVTEIHPEASGLITGIYFTEGAYVSAGKVLATIKDDDLRAQLNKLKVQERTAQQTAERYKSLLEISGVSQQDYDIKVLERNSLLADMQILRAQLVQTKIIAPFSGKVGLRNISKGAYVTPQTAVTTLRKVDKLKLDFTVPEKYGALMAKGNPVYFTIDNMDKKFLATVIATENFITEATRSLNVRAVVASANAELVAGQFAKIEIPLGNASEAYMIPSQAIIPRARNKEILLLINGKAEIREITTGIRDSARVEVLTGIKAGDSIITTGLMSIKPGAAVNVSKSKKP